MNYPLDLLVATLAEKEPSGFHSDREQVETSSTCM